MTGPVPVLERQPSAQLERHETTDLAGLDGPARVRTVRKVCPMRNRVRNRVLVVLALALAPSGCTAMSLERHTVNQSQTVTDYRYHAALHALAMVAADPHTLPSYSLVANGVAAVTDTGMLSTTTTWSGQPEVFASQMLGLTGSRSPNLQWTVSTVAEYSQLEAMRCACRWVLEGPEGLGPDCLHLLADPETDLSPGPHFGVTQRLTRLPQGWLHVGRLGDVPARACYKDHCGDTWVWVTPEGMEGLAAFTLVLQDISTLNVVDPTAPATVSPPTLVTLWVVQATLPEIVINIERKDGRLQYRKEGDDQPKPVEVTVGQSVRWRNLDAQTHTATSDTRGIFDTGDIKPNDSAVVPFNDDLVNLVKKAGSSAGQSVGINYSSQPQAGKNKGQPKSTINLFRANSLYSQTLVFRVDRVVRPECQCRLQERLNEKMAKQNAAVNISWDEWMAWTAPFQGQRTGVTPGSGTGSPMAAAAAVQARSRLVTVPSGDRFRDVLPRPLPTIPSGDFK